MLILSVADFQIILFVFYFMADSVELETSLTLAFYMFTH